MTMKCDCCRGSRFKFLYNNYDRLYRKTNEEFPIVKCLTCDLEFICPQPPKHRIKEFYPTDYYSFGNNATERPRPFHAYLFELQAATKTELKAKLMFLLFFPFYRLFVNRSLPKPLADQRLLDMGCGDGRFLYYAKKLGYEVAGVEPFGFNPELSQNEGFVIHGTSLPEAKFSDGYFDIVTINHVMEHVDSPSEVFAELGRVTKAGGKIILATPNSGSIGKKIFGKYWYHLDTPRHLFLLGLGNIRKYAEMNGFTIVHVNYNGDFSGYLNSMLYMFEDKLGVKLKLPKLIKILLLPGVSVFSEITNMLKCGDFIEVTLKKDVV